MRFKVRDLMIAVLPEAGAGEAMPQLVCNPTLCACTRFTEGTICVGCTCTCTECTECTGRTCTACSNCTGCTGCTRTCQCSGCSIVTCEPFASRGPVEAIAAQPETLAQLKEQLKQALERVEEQERALDESMMPQTVDEVDQLEAKLQAALEELRARRETLQQRAAS